MKKMTKAEAIENHRKMWSWIVEETEKREEIVKKQDYFDAMGIDVKERPFCDCYACQYAIDATNREAPAIRCEACPIDWGGDGDRFFQCSQEGTAYAKWRDAVRLGRTWGAAVYALEIANLPPAREEKGTEE